MESQELSKEELKYLNYLQFEYNTYIKIIWFFIILTIFLISIIILSFIF
jgi:hypothetical protein